MIIKLEAIDTLFFRDGKPFGNSDDNWAESLNFPSLSVIYGAIRSAYFSQNNLDFSLSNTDKDVTKNLKINGVYFYDTNKQKLIFKIPQDLYIYNEKLKFFDLKENFSTSNNLDFIFEAEDDDIEKRDVFISKLSFKKYLKGKDGFSFEEISDYILTESKIGIGLNKSIKNVEEGKIYRVGAKRYTNLSLIVDFEGIELKKKGLLRLGGEGKAVSYEEFNELDIPKIDKMSGDIFKMYLLTPAIFKNGWYPDFLNENFEGKINGVRIKLIAASLGKSEYIGGWDMKHNSPKSMYKAVPAGSVYYFRVLDGKKEDILKIDNIIDNKEYKKQGFGKVIIADYKEKK